MFDHPAKLCRCLANGSLDVALVSSFEFLRNPIYRIVDRISISSDGPVYSVVVAHTGKLSDLAEIELDPAAETSVNLLRCLLSESGLRPRFVKGAATSPIENRGRLLIGDQAIQFRRAHESEFKFWDLGEQWKRLAQLPFVYALWLVRPEVKNAEKIADRLRLIRDQNLQQIERLIAEHENPPFCDRYYREHLRFNFGMAEKDGLRLFEKLCGKHGLLPKRATKFDLV